MKIFTVKNEKMRLNINPIPKLNEKVIFSVWYISIDFNIIAANITGIDKNKENFDEFKKRTNATLYYYYHYVFF